MHQPFWSHHPAAPNGNGIGNPFTGSHAGTTVVSLPQFVWQPLLVAGTLRNLRIRVETPPGAGENRTYTIWTNNLGETGLSVTISDTDTEGEDTSTEIAISAGDHVWLRQTTSGSAATTQFQSCIEYDIDDVTSHYVFGGFPGGQLGSGSTLYDGALYGGFWVTNSDNRPESICMVPGTITKYGVNLSASPGSGKSRTFVLFKNGVAQDGTGGTPDTTLVFSDSETFKEATFTLTVLAFDRLKVRMTPTNSPDAAARAHGGVVFVADNPGEFTFGAAPDDAITTDATEYGFPTSRSGQITRVWDADEANREYIGPTNPILIEALVVRVTTAPSLGNSLALTVRKNQADTSITAEVESGTLEGSTLGHNVEITSADRFTVKGVSNGSTSTQITYFAYVGRDSTFIPDSPDDSPPEETSPPPDRTPPVSTTPSPTECPCPEPGGNPPIDGGHPPDNPGNSGGNPGGEGHTPGAVCENTGGTVNAYEETPASETFTDERQPRVFARFGFVQFSGDEAEDASIFRAMDATMPDAPHDTFGARKSGDIFTVSPCIRGMSDDNGNFTGQHVSLQFNDKGRQILRERMGDDDLKYVWEREIVVWLASEENRRSGYTLADPREIHRGFSYDIEFGPRFTGTISSEDRVVSQVGAFGPDRSFSTRLLTLGLLPGLPRDLVGKPQQWIYGEVSDEGAIDISTGLPQSKGLVPLWLVGALGDEDEYHLAAHDIGGLTLYGSDGETPPARVQLSEGTDYRWETLDLTDSETGLVHRVTHVYLPTGSVATEAHKSGGVHLAANVCGKLGANGQTITDLFKIYQAVFELQILPTVEYHTGPYPDGPFYADGRAMILSDSFVDAQEFSIDRIGGEGYKGGFVFGGPGDGAVSVREALRRMSNSGDCWFTFTAAGQLKVVLLDDTADVDAAPVLKEPARIRQMPSPRYAYDEVENPVLYAYDYDDDKKAFRVPQARIVNLSALTRMGRAKPSPQPVEMRCVRDHMTARDVAARRLLRRQFPPQYVDVVEPIDGIDRDPGDIIKITSQEGPGTGYDETPVFIKETRYDPQTRRNTHHCRVLTDIIAGFGEWASDLIDLWDDASEEEQAENVFWANDDDLIPTEMAAGQEWR